MWGKWAVRVWELFIFLALQWSENLQPVTLPITSWQQTPPQSSWGFATRDQLSPKWEEVGLECQISTCPVVLTNFWFFSVIQTLQEWGRDLTSSRANSLQLHPVSGATSPWTINKGSLFNNPGLENNKNKCKCKNANFCFYLQMHNNSWTLIISMVLLFYIYHCTTCCKQTQLCNSAT